MSTRLPCCFSVFYDYPSWRTGGSPLVPQVPGYPITHIIHSFLTIINYKTVCACRSSIMDIPPVPNQPKTFKFPQCSFGQKTPVKRNFQSSWFANRTWLHYDEANDLAYYHVCMLLTETENWTVRILIRRSYSMDFPTGKMLEWPLKHDSSKCHRDSVRDRNSCVQCVCVVRCSNISVIKNISSNISTKLTEFINRNCTQDAIKMHLQPFWT